MDHYLIDRPAAHGDEADATGFPDLHDGFLTLTGGEVLDRKISAPIAPRSVTWSELATSHHLFDLVSTEAEVVAENRGAAQDEYVLSSGGNLFSAIYRRPPPRTLHPQPFADEARGPRLEGSRRRESASWAASNPFDTAGAIRHPDAHDRRHRHHRRASWLNVGNLVRVVGILLVFVLIVGVWGWILRMKVQHQTATINAHAETEAAE